LRATEIAIVTFFVFSDLDLSLFDLKIHDLFMQ